MATIYPTLIPRILMRERASVSALNKLTAATLVGTALSLLYVQAMLLHLFEPRLAVLAVIELIAAGLVLGYPVQAWRWTPLLATLFGGLMLVGQWNVIVYELAHPANFHPFAYMVVTVMIAVVGVVAGGAAAVQNYRYPAAERSTPRGLTYALVGTGMLCVGIILTAAIPHETSSAVNPELVAGLPALTTPGFNFDQTELYAQAGETVALRLENTHGVPHTFDIDDLNVHTAMPPGESGLALFRAREPGTYTYYCAVPGHRELGMEGTLVVQP